MRNPNGGELRISLERGTSPLYRQIYRAISRAIVDGSLQAGDNLPSSRQLADELGVSRPTVDKAYLQLAAEGYVKSRERSGHVVQRLDIDFLAHKGRKTEGAANRIRLPRFRFDYMEEFGRQEGIAYDFAYAKIAPGIFPKRDFLRAVGNAVYYKGDDVLDSYPIESRPGNLQIELARHIRRTRGIDCDPLQVVVFASTDAALQAIFHLFGPDAVVGIEEPGYSVAAETARRGGQAVRPLNAENGWQGFLESLASSRTDVVFTTPSHQFPTGALMPLATRIEILKWAERNDAFIIEDDSCHEYRYTTWPVPALGSIDSSNRVVYLSNFSKTLSPGLRVAYAVLPRGLAERYFEMYATSMSGVAQVVQEAIAELLSNGVIARTVRAAVMQNKRKNALMKSLLRESLSGIVDFEGGDSGLHLFASVRNGMTQRELIDSAAERGAKVYAADYCWFSSPPPGNKVIIGYSSIEPSLIEPGIGALRAAWENA